MTGGWGSVGWSVRRPRRPRRSVRWVRHDITVPVPVPLPQFESRVRNLANPVWFVGDPVWEPDDHVGTAPMFDERDSSAEPHRGLAKESILRARADGCREARSR